MILNLLRTEDLSVEDMIKRSFSEFATQRALGARDVPAQLDRVTRQLAREKEKGLQACIKGDPPDIESYYACSKGVVRMTAQLLAGAGRVARQGVQSLLGLGRFIRVTIPPRLVGAVGVVVGASDAAACVAVVLCPEGFIPPPPKEAADNKPRSSRASSSNQSGLGGPVVSPAAGGGGPAREERAVEAYGSVGGRWYALLSVRAGELLMVTSRRLKRVEAEGVMEQAGTGRGGAALDGLMKELVKAAGEGEALESLDFEKELKAKDVDFVNSARRYMVHAVLGLMSSRALMGPHAYLFTTGWPRCKRHSPPASVTPVPWWPRSTHMSIGCSASRNCGLSYGTSSPTSPCPYSQTTRLASVGL
jgi:hypothetical protein